MGVHSTFPAWSTGVRFGRFPGSGSQSVQRSREDWFEVSPLPHDRGSGEHEVQHLLDDCNLTLTQLSTAWAANHPAVSSVIIGPRTMVQLEGYLAADGVTLSEDVLNHIDSVVAPGATLDIADTMWAHGTRALDLPERRR